MNNPLDRTDQRGSFNELTVVQNRQVSSSNGAFFFLVSEMNVIAVRQI